MIKVTKVQVPQKSGATLTMKKKEYIQDTIKNKSAQKKDKIVQIIDEGDQLTLLAILIEQIGEKVGLDTPEFTQAKQVFSQIKGILS